MDEIDKVGLISRGQNIVKEFLGEKEEIVNNDW